MPVSHSEIRPHRPTQEVILEAACELISSHGFGGMSMRALAQQVGIHPGSIYNYFSCKQDILEEVAELLITERIHDWRGCKPRSRNPALQLDAFVNFHFGERVGHQAAQQILATELRHLGGASRERIKEHYAVYVDELRGIIDRGSAGGVFDAPQAAATAQTILAMLDGLIGAELLNLDLFDQKTVLEVKNIINKILGC